MQSRRKYDDPKWIGQKIGYLTVLEAVYVKDKFHGHWKWKVRCDCGNEKIMNPYSIIMGESKGCGCKNYSHLESHTRLHNIWCSINNRCNPEHVGTERYGKRGIRICDEWKDYEVFAEWARANGYGEGLTIERRDVNGNYCPENCCWIPLEKQARNRSTTRWVEFQGQKMSLAEAAEIAGLPYKQVHYRIKHGWSVEDALTTPMKEKSELQKRCEAAGVDYKKVYQRVHTYGWSEDDAINIPNLGKGANQTTYSRTRENQR